MPAAGGDGEGLRSTTITRRRASVRVAGTLTLPVLVGIAMGVRWPTAGDNFFASVSQIIATLFIAMAVELFTRDMNWKEPLARLQALCLVALSWVGLFACLRALVGGGSRVSVGMTGAGVTAASTLVAMTLYARITETGQGIGKRDGTATAVLLLLIAVPVLLLSIM